LICELFPNARAVALPAETRPILCVVVHTEEEFDWEGQYAPGDDGVEHMRHINRVQDLFDDFGIVPNYVIDYPIASKPQAFEALARFQTDGRALVGAHLHPWVSPPFSEELTRPNTYPGNLPAKLEREKLAQLTDTIAKNFGKRPVTYLAGRYGNGPNSAQILEDLGFEVDISATPPFDLRGDGGPDYSRMTAEPFWFGRTRRLLGLPCGGGYAGWLRRAGTPLYRLLTARPMRFARLTGIAARLRAFERMRLSPEGYTLAEMQRLTRAMLADGLRVFVFSFHSPSVAPGLTPYVRTEADLADFLGKTRGYLDWFTKEMRGRSMTPLEIKTMLDRT
jgi:hypothetical protein